MVFADFILLESQHVLAHLFADHRCHRSPQQSYYRVQRVYFTLTAYAVQHDIPVERLKVKRGRKDCRAKKAPYRVCQGIKRK
jgi:hypothetical protein